MRTFCCHTKLKPTRESCAALRGDADACCLQRIETYAGGQCPPLPAPANHWHLHNACTCEPVPLAAFAPLAPAALSELRPDVSTTRPNGRSARHDTTRKRFPATLAAFKISRVKAKPLCGGLRPALTLLVTAVRKLTAAMTHMGQPLLLPRSEWQK